MTAKHENPQHIRLAEKSGFARGQKDVEGDGVQQPDPRVASQDPALKKLTPPREVHKIKPPPE